MSSGDEEKGKILISPSLSIIKGKIVLSNMVC